MCFYGDFWTADLSFGVCYGAIYGAGSEMEDDVAFSIPAAVERFRDPSKVFSTRTKSKIYNRRRFHKNKYNN
ncbi:unnamed protein product [Calypogeia fissa]